MLSIIFYILLYFIIGYVSSAVEKFKIAKNRFKGVIPFFISVFTILFISIGGYIYYVNNILNIRKSSKEREIETVEWEKKYKKFENYVQPRIVSVNVNVDIFPSTRDISASGKYTMVNKSLKSIDSIFLNHNSAINTFKFDNATTVLEDTVYNFDIYARKTSKTRILGLLLL